MVFANITPVWRKMPKVMRRGITKGGLKGDSASHTKSSAANTGTSTTRSRTKIICGISRGKY